GVGGKPTRSKVTRRIRVARSASSDGLSPRLSKLARTKESIGVRTQVDCRTAGIPGRQSGRSDHQPLELLAAAAGFSSARRLDTSANVAMRVRHVSRRSKSRMIRTALGWEREQRR